MTMATAMEQWVLVEMVQALYEVSLAARAAPTHAWPRGGVSARVDCGQTRGEVGRGVGPITPRPSVSPWKSSLGHTVPVAKCLEGPAGAETESLGLICERGARPGSCLGAGRENVGGGTGERLVLKNQTWA